MESQGMIDFPIVDTHLHIWDTNKLRYPWLDAIPLLNRPYLPEKYNAACGHVKVDAMVFLQCECDPVQYRQEAEWVSGLAQQERRIQGIVPWAPLEKGEAVGPELEALCRNKLVKGIRRIIQFEQDPEFCLRPDFIKGVRLLADFDLSFDICVSHFQMANAIEFVRQCPEVQFILDHIGKPDIRNRILDPWRTKLKRLAEFPNVYCKLSGLVTEADHRSWTQEDLKPYIDHVIGCFGWDRVMYGGDWPVACQATDYPRWVQALSWAVRGCSKQELRKLFSGNAIRFYRLPGLR